MSTQERWFSRGTEASRNGVSRRAFPNRGWERGKTLFGNALRETPFRARRAAKHRKLRFSLLSSCRRRKDGFRGGRRRRETEFRDVRSQTGVGNEVKLCLGTHSAKLRFAPGALPSIVNFVSASCPHVDAGKMVFAGDGGVAKRSFATCVPKQGLGTR